MSQLPEIREADAPPEIAEIYADIKATAALPQVNLIFRYLATHPGVLAWVWQALRPLYGSQELASAGADLMRAVPRAGPSPLPQALSGGDLAGCADVIDAYNVANPQNLIALMALVRAMEPAALGRAGAVVLTAREAAVVAGDAFPPVPRRDRLGADLLARVETMSARHPVSRGAVPSMYLHLALWPAALVAVDAYLQPIVESPNWRPRVAGIIAQAEQIATDLAAAVELPPERPDVATLGDVTEVIAAFNRQMIPELIAVGRLLAVA